MKVWLPNFAQAAGHRCNLRDDVTGGLHMWDHHETKCSDFFGGLAVDVKGQKGWKNGKNVSENRFLEMLQKPCQCASFFLTPLSFQCAMCTRRRESE